ncbi:MAG: hypothetical protein ACI8TX_002428 [Hyphomicrobiaceae bacterium]|jgi:hypothetical protein
MSLAPDRVHAAANAARNGDGIELGSQALLAPTLPETRAAIDRLEALARSADATALALFRVHNRFGELRSRGTGRPSCSDAWLVDLSSRARLLGGAFRDHAQSARAQAQRTQRLMTAPTVQPLVDAGTHFRAVQLFARIDVLERRYLEASVWHRAYVESVAKTCTTRLVPARGIAGVRLPRADQDWEPPAVEPPAQERSTVSGEDADEGDAEAGDATVEDTGATAGQEAEESAAESAPESEATVEPSEDTDVPTTIPPPARSSQESPLLELGAIETGPIAVLAVGGGLLCPAGIRADGVVVLDETRGCWAPLRCDCEPEPLLPAAVLGRVDLPVAPDEDATSGATSGAG